MNKNIFNNLSINVSHHIHTLLFQKLLSRRTTPAPAPKSAPVLPRMSHNAQEYCFHIFSSLISNLFISFFNLKTQSILFPCIAASLTR